MHPMKTYTARNYEPQANTTPRKLVRDCGLEWNKISPSVRAIHALDKFAPALLFDLTQVYKQEMAKTWRRFQDLADENARLEHENAKLLLRNAQLSEENAFAQQCAEHDMQEDADICSSLEW